MDGYSCTSCDERHSAGFVGWTTEAMMVQVEKQVGLDMRQKRPILLSEMLGKDDVALGELTMTKMTLTLMMARQDSNSIGLAGICERWERLS